MKKINVLVIGQGFMGGTAHPRAILEANIQLRPRGLEFVMDCIAGRDAAKLARTQKMYGYNRISTSWKQEIGTADLVVITTPNKEHREMAKAALAAGKAVVCEKPLGASLAQSQEMAAAAKAAGTPTMVTFGYEGAPGVLEARRLVQEGLVIGTSGSFEASSQFLQDWGRAGRTDFRFNADQGLGGVIEDLGTHQVDIIQFITGKKIVEVSALTRMYDGDGEDLRMVRGSDARAKGKAVDAFEAIGYFENGSTCTFKSNRTSTGRKAFFETTVHGNRGALQWELEDQQHLKFYSESRPDGHAMPAHERGWTSIHVSDSTPGVHMNTDTIQGMSNGYLQYFRWEYVHFGLQLLGEPDKTYTVPSFAAACQVEAVTDAIYRSGLDDGRLTAVPRV